MKTHNHRLMCGTRCAMLGWYDLLCPFCYIGQGRKVVRRGMVSPGRPDIPEIRPEIPGGGISKRLSVLSIHYSRIPRSRFLDSRRWLDSPFDAQGRQRHSTR